MTHQKIGQSTIVFHGRCALLSIDFIVHKAVSLVDSLNCHGIFICTIPFQRFQQPAPQFSFLQAFLLSVVTSHCNSLYASAKVWIVEKLTARSLEQIYGMRPSGSPSVTTFCYALYCLLGGVPAGGFQACYIDHLQRLPLAHSGIQTCSCNVQKQPS